MRRWSPTRPVPPMASAMPWAIGYTARLYGGRVVGPARWQLLDRPHGPRCGSPRCCSPCSTSYPCAACRRPRRRPGHRRFQQRPAAGVAPASMPGPSPLDCRAVLPAETARKSCFRWMARRWPCSIRARRRTISRWKHPAAPCAAWPWLGQRQADRWILPPSAARRSGCPDGPGQVQITVIDGAGPHGIQRGVAAVVISLRPRGAFHSPSRISSSSH